MRVIIFLILIISFVNAKKVALIIGISDYENYPKLSTPLNNVRDMNKALMDMGFKTLTLKNGSKSEFKQMLERFRKEAFNAEIALIYFSGHGTSIDGKNYLFLKDDKTVNSKKDIRKLVKLDEFIDTVSGAESGVVVIDACRSNFSIKKNQKGFVPILSKSDTVILTASKFGEIVSAKEESMLTKVLLKVIKEKISLNKILQKTQKYVFLETKYRQSPTVINSDKANSIYLGRRLIIASRPPITSRPIIPSQDIAIKSHGYTFISTMNDIEELRNMNTYVFLPDNISSQNNRKSKKYKRYEKVLELIQEAPKYDINITSLGTKAKEINRFILMNKKSNEKKITVESYNYDLANDIVNHIRNEAENFLERRREREGS